MNHSAVYGLDENGGPLPPTVGRQLYVIPPIDWFLWPRSEMKVPLDEALRIFNKWTVDEWRELPEHSTATHIAIGSFKRQ